MSDDFAAPLVAQNLATLAYERLERAIMEGDLPPGERLSESGLARRFGISRGPLREAIGQLEGRGLVERVSNQGARVVALDTPDLIDLMVVREALEGMACRLAAERMAEPDLARLAALLEAHAQAEPIVSGRGYFQGTGDRDFHQLILRASGNRRLAVQLGSELYPLLRLYRHRLSMRPGRPAEALAEHRAILEALSARHPDRAEEAMRAHVRAARQALEEGRGPGPVEAESA
ncbi:GntR family transcriptional regulator [Rhodovulum sp. 12E13]|uniref:GntR family transcriptional regulator n=1 Tax=Rhodovulum sp. 12E13 TaxID=2203891 RepID=UPI000E18ACC8|nr:GntR family transcriptional regulator [Rhodovulum sp. 12E13]RDC75235.1 GntR family transcriptional regulator [Rhodovulum sp. 12E13]